MLAERPLSHHRADPRLAPGEPGVRERGSSRRRVEFDFFFERRALALKRRAAKGRRMEGHISLEERFPPSEPCSCDFCTRCCKRPGWWTVAQAERAFQAGYAGRMMLEVAPDFRFGVLSPAFRGCEGNFALKEYAQAGCTFLKKGLCALHATGFEPIECLFCHHDRVGQGPVCHRALEKDWDSVAGRRLVNNWITRVGLLKHYGGQGR